MKHRISRRAFLRGCTLLAASAAVGSLTSCGGTNAKDSSLPQIIVGSDTYPPYIYLNNDGVPAGIDVEIATEAFRRMGYAARFETIDWEQKTTLVESGALDCIWGCFSMDGREEAYRWAGPYMVSRQVVAVDADSSIQSLSDLAGKTIAVQSTGKRAIGTSLAIRLVLDQAATTQEAVDLLRGYDMIASNGRDYHFYITDASGDGRIVEYDCLSETRELVDTPIRSITNFFALYADRVQPDQKNDIFGHGKERYEKIEAILTAAADSITEDDAWDALKAASQLPKEGDVTSNTQWSALYNDTDLTLDLVLRRDWDVVTSYSLTENAIR